MIPSKDYLDQISKKLDSFNKINGIDPSVRSSVFDDNFDMMDHMGRSAIEYMNRKKSENTSYQIDPLFTDHNKY
jgi:hypothetical protein